MAVTYVKFSCQGSPTNPNKCTTPWDKTIKCSIPICGTHEGMYYNLMVMEGDENLINQWVNENTGKVQIITKDQANQLGRLLVPPGTERTGVRTLDQEKPVTYVATEFDVDHPENLWVVKQ